MKPIIRYGIAIIVQLGILAGLILFRQITASTGTEILLAIEPVDPTSPLRGDYATFGYRGISRFDTYLADGLAAGETVYVILRKDGTYWEMARVSTKKPADGSVLYLRGRVVSSPGDRRTTGFRMGQSLQVTVAYGIEEYFIPEGLGRDFRFGQYEMAARVAVDENGNAVLKQLYADGEKWP